MFAPIPLFLKAHNGISRTSSGLNCKGTNVFQRSTHLLQSPPSTIPGFAGDSGLHQFEAIGGNTYRFQSFPELRKRFGEIVKLDFPYQKSVMIFDPEDFKRVFNSEGKYPYGIAQITSGLLAEADPIFHNLVTAVGPEWRELRSLVQKDITPPQVAQSYLPLLKPHLEELAEKWNSISHLPEAYVIASVALFHVVLFGSSMNVFERPWKENEWYQFVERGKGIVTSLSRYRNANDPEKRQKIKQEMVAEFRFVLEITKEATFKALKETHKWFDKPCRPYIFRFLERGENAQKEINSGKTIVSLLAAALDTTANTIHCLMYTLATCPEAQERLYQELKSVLKGGLLGEEHLKNIPYLKACLKETFRLFNVTSSNGRVLESEITIKGHQIPPSVLIEMSSLPWCLDPNIFPDPLEFKPERWINNENKIHNHPYLILPFGFGARLCLGSRIAETEILAFASSILQKYQLKATKNPNQRFLTLGITSLENPPIIQYIPRSH